jgi:GNAT superfamily N-acetyltransferase
MPGPGRTSRIVLDHRARLGQAGRVTVTVRPLQPGDRDAATAADRASMQTFWDAGIPLPDDPDEELEGDLLLVGLLDGQVAGVACVDLHDGARHLAQMSVHPSAQRRGVGSALLLDVVARAAAAGASAVTLTTFRDVPFNGPFYARHGFEPVDESLHPWLAEARMHERAEGIDVLPRTAMRLALPDGPDA